MADVLFTVILSFLAIFLILLVLVQRGRGGGLAGALGGMGGSSAFGAKAGDVFTRITIITAAIWIAICLIAVFWAKHGGDALSTASPSSSSSSPLDAPPSRPLERQPGRGDSTVPPAAESLPQAEAPAAATETAESAPVTPGADDGAPAPPENQ
jgi:preprotein translocase subunit SecG